MSLDTIDDMMAWLDSRGYDAVLVVCRREGMVYAPMPPDNPEHVHATLAMRPPLAAAQFLLVGVRAELLRVEEMTGLDLTAQLDKVDELFRGMKTLLPDEEGN